MNIDITKETREVDKLFEEISNGVEKGKMPSKDDLARFKRLSQQVDTKMAEGFKEGIEELKKEGRPILAIFAQAHLDEFNRILRSHGCQTMTELV